MRKKALTRNEREIQIINWFAIRIQHDNDEYATSHEIAGGLGVSPSSKLRAILNGMVGDEILERVEMQQPGRWDGWGYRLKRGTFQRPPSQTRTVVVNSRSGQTQMELW